MKNEKIPKFFLALLFITALGLASCEGLARDMGVSQPSDLEQRAGVTGTEDNPTPLDPFKQYDLVMSGNECRYFSMQVPSKWFWKIFLTAANREDGRRGLLTAEIQQATPAWASLPGTNFHKTFDLGREGLQAVLAIGNNDSDRVAIFKLCQEGAPLHITIQSQVASTNVITSPDKNQAVTTQGN